MQCSQYNGNLGDHGGHGGHGGHGNNGGYSSNPVHGNYYKQKFDVAYMFT